MELSQLLLGFRCEDKAGSSSSTALGVLVFRCETSTNLVSAGRAGGICLERIVSRCHFVTEPAVNDPVTGNRNPQVIANDFALADMHFFLS